MRRIGRFFDERNTFLRLVLLDLSGLAYLLFRPHPEGQPTRTQWALALLAFVAVLALHRWPWVSVVTQVALFGTALSLVDDATINQVGSSWALLELTIAAARPVAIWSSAAVLSGVYLAFVVNDPLDVIARSAFGLCIAVGLPVLLGLNVRGSRALTRQAEQLAGQERHRRESELHAARANERSTIARELHDVVAHHVASMVLRVAVAKHVLPDADPRVLEVFDDVHGTGTAALADLRHLVAVLRDPDAARGDAALTAIEPSALPAALWAAVHRAERTGLTVEADIAPSVGTLDAVRGLAVLRLTQEGLTNVAKHVGSSATARLSVSVVDGDVHWEVLDDGGADAAPPYRGGVDPSTADRGGVDPGTDRGGAGSATADRGGAGLGPPDRALGGGHGLTGMRERVELLGGRLEAGRSGSGWRLRTVLPAPSLVPESAG